MEDIKKCTKCKEKRQLDAFYFNPFRADMLETQCKSCFASSLEAKLNKYPPNVRAEKIKKFWFDRTKKFANAKQKIYKKNNPIKAEAHRQMRAALRRGELIKPHHCESCRSSVRLNGHHDDYAIPLAVRWLCTSCHVKWHRENGPGANEGADRPYHRVLQEREEAKWAYLLEGPSGQQNEQKLFNLLTENGEAPNGATPWYYPIAKRYKLRKKALRAIIAALPQNKEKQL